VWSYRGKRLEFSAGKFSFSGLKKLPKDWSLSRPRNCPSFLR
jgi:hypothetical protein